MLIGVFSDAHGHIDGFCRARDLLYSYGVRKFFYLGDAVGYIPLASVVHELRNESHILSLRGNHEDMLLSNQPGERDDKDLYQHHIVRDLLDENDLTFLSMLPTSRSEQIDGLRLLFVHGSPHRPINGYIYPDSSLSEYSKLTADVVFMGHTHHPFVREEEGRLFVNVGSCGLPRDSNPRGCAALFDTANKDLRLLRFSLAKSSRRILKNVRVAAPVAKYLERYMAVVNDL